MAWGARSNLGIDDLVARVASDESNLTALALLPSRRFGAAEAAALDPQQRMLLECGAEALGKAPGMEGRRKIRGGEGERERQFF